MSIEEIKEIKKKRVSFSQYSTFLKCPQKWYLDYVKNLRVKDDNINTTFGTAIHHAFQTYLTSLYNEGVGIADSLDVKKLFLDKFNEEIKKVKDIKEEEFTDFIFDGNDIIDTFCKSANRLKYFPTKDYELIGIEIPLEIPIKNNVEFVGFIDIVLKERNKEYYRIIDFKTSSSGWNSYMKEDVSKLAQLHLYKSVYSKKFNVPLNNIEVEFFIVKRKLYENVSFPQSRIQVFKPAAGPTVIKESIKSFVEFLDYGFTPDGNYNETNQYIKVPGNGKKHCKYCTHYKKLCDGKATKL
jgi:CRISPR/Cas system-associated exonuclease Cas4 (RecB family)